MTDSTAVTKTETNGNPVEEIRARGATAVAERRAANDMFKMLEGCEWGSGTSVIKGAAFSQATRMALAKFCVVTRANPQIHVDMLGGKPYLNAQYYYDLVNSHPRFIDARQINIGKAVADQLRTLAKRALTDADDPDLKEIREDAIAEARRLMSEAHEIEALRSKYSVPDWASEAVVTVIRRYTDVAPLEAIALGTVEDVTPFIREVHACNWAGNWPTNKPDPVGNAEPAKTAQTRSFRRCARSAFAAWMEQYDREIDRANEIVEAEWYEIKGDRAAAAAQLPAGNGAQAVATGTGEPEAVAPSNGARDLPVEDTTDDDWTDKEREAARGFYFGNIRDAGLAETRKKWQQENGLPDSYNLFTKADFDRAIALLTGPVRQQLIDGVGIAGFDSVTEYCRARNITIPRSVSEMQAVLQQVNTEIDA